MSSPSAVLVQAIMQAETEAGIGTNSLEFVQQQAYEQFTTQPAATVAQVSSLYSSDPGFADRVATLLGVASNTPVGLINPTDIPNIPSNAATIASQTMGISSPGPTTTQLSTPSNGDSSGGDSGEQSTASKVMHGVLSVVAPPLADAIDQSWLTRGAMIALGLIMVGAGVFSFKTTQTVIRVGGKIAAKAAESGA